MALIVILIWLGNICDFISHCITFIIESGFAVHLPVFRMKRRLSGITAVSFIFCGTDSSKVHAKPILEYRGF